MTVVVTQAALSGRSRTRRPARVVSFAVVGLLSSAFLTALTVLTSAVSLAATSVVTLLVPGTGTPNANIVKDYMSNAWSYYVAGTDPARPAECDALSDCTLTGIDYPAQFWPWPFPGWGGLEGDKWNVSVGEGVTNLNGQLVDLLADPDGPDEIVLFGYSQGARVTSIVKENLADLDPEVKERLSIYLIGNPSRPNGGNYSRFAFLGYVPIFDITIGNPTPTDTDIFTTDVAFEYDGVADFPLYILNPLAVLNAAAGFAYVHGTYLAPNGGGSGLPDGYTQEELDSELNDPANRWTYGDTTYITIPTRTLPLLRPFINAAQLTGTLDLASPPLELVQPFLREIVDLGYDRSINPGEPTQARLIPPVDPVDVTVKLVGAVAQGIADATDGIPIDVPYTPITPTLTAARTVSPTAADSLDEPELSPAAKSSIEAEPDSDTGKPGRAGRPARKVVAPAIKGVSDLVRSVTGTLPGRSTQPSTKRSSPDAGNTGSPDAGQGSDAAASAAAPGLR